MGLPALITECENTQKCWELPGSSGWTVQWENLSFFGIAGLSKVKLSINYTPIGNSAMHVGAGNPNSVPLWGKKW